jgi:hypothetical protein
MNTDLQIFIVGAMMCTLGLLVPSHPEEIVKLESNQKIECSVINTKK